jgi:DGQHR domain-containing protein
MYCRPEGATQNEVRAACGGPQRNKATEAARRGQVRFTTARRKSGLLAYFLRAPGGSIDASAEIPTQPLSATQTLRSPFRSMPNTLPTTKERPVPRFKVPAARVKQGDLIIYTTALKVRQLVADGFYSVETLDPENPDDKGFQRLLNKGRAKKVADYVVQGQDRKDAFLPTSVFLATHHSIDFNPSENSIEIDTASVCPLSVVDGQHRLEGLKIAAERDPRVLDFEIPVNIAVNLSKIAQMCHFLIVNSTQKSVDKSVEQRIIGRLTDALEVEDIPSLPRWILHIVEKGEVDKAIKLADYLNETEDSPWFGKIRMANVETSDGTINQRSFVKAIVKYVLTANNPISVYRDFDKEKRIFLNYWKAIASTLDDGDSETLYKYGGVELFSKFSIPFFMRLQNTGRFTVAAMEDLLRSCFENVEGDYAGVGHPEWWKTGGQAGRLNSGALNIVAQEMAKALNKASLVASAEQIEL